MRRFSTFGRALGGALVLALGSAGIASAVDLEEGGYAGTSNEGHTTVVYNFLRHFSYNQYYYSYDFCWESNNYYYVDNMDFAIFAGHGNQFIFQGYDGQIVDVRNVGNFGQLGYGDTDLEFLAFQTCKTVPSPIERPNDWWSWVNNGAAFDGMHQAVGFRTNSYQSTDQDVTYFFGRRMRDGYNVWESWFDAIDAEARSDEMGCAVMYPGSDGESYARFGADPPRDHRNLRCYWQY